MPTPTPYSAHLRVGTHVWDVVSGDDADYGPIAGLVHRWQPMREDDGWPVQHDPTPLVFGVIVEEGVDFSDVDQGTAVHFTFTPDGYASPLVNYGGNVRDLTARPHPRGMVYTITAIDHLQRLKEDYVSGATSVAAAPGQLWDVLAGPAAGTLGTSSGPPNYTPLPDPFGGQTSRPGTYPTTGSWGSPFTIYGPTWTMFTSFSSWDMRRRVAATGEALTPALQRALFNYQLGTDGNLLPPRPFIGSWATAGPRNAPRRLVNVGGVWKSAQGNVDASLLAEGGTEWSRQRIEPNTTITDTLAPVSRPHTGPDVVRRIVGGILNPESGTSEWILSGTEQPDQWGTRWLLRAARDPLIVKDWFTPSLAMQTMVVAYDIEPRHTPSGAGVQLGMLSSAELTIPEGGDWYVSFTLRRTLPDPTNPVTGGWETPGATWAELDPAMTWAAIDPTLTWADFYLIGA